LETTIKLLIVIAIVIFIIIKYNKESKANGAKQAAGEASKTIVLLNDYEKLKRNLENNKQKNDTCKSKDEKENDEHDVHEKEKKSKLNENKEKENSEFDLKSALINSTIIERKKNKEK